MRLLVVDDEEDVVLELCDYLTSINHDCVSCTTLEAADAALSSEPDFAAVLSDIRMPGGKGLDLLRKSRERPARLRPRFIFMTGQTEVDDVVTALRLGAHDFLQKPVSLADLDGRLKEVARLRAEEEDSLSRQVVIERQLTDNLARLEEALSHPAVARDDREASRRIITHELMTPLTAVQGFGELLAAGAGGLPRETLADYAKEVLGGAQDLSRKLGAIIEWLDLETFTDRGRLESFDPAEAVEGAMEKVALRRSDKTVSSSLPVGELRVFHARRWLERSLELLLENAVKFSHSRVEIGLVADGRMHGVTLFVDDDGPGMGAADRTRAVQPFAQVSGGVARTYGGLGLGLPLARRYVEAGGGRLVLATAPGGGLRALITVRIAEPGSGGSLG